MIQAWNLPDVAVIQETAADLGREQLAELMSTVEVAHRQPFDRVVAEATLAAEPQTHLVDGPAARAIHGLAVLYGADSVVLGAGSW